MSGSRSKKSDGKYDDPKAGTERPVLGTGMAEKAAQAAEQQKKTKEERLKEIMGEM